MNTLEQLRDAVRVRLGQPEADNFYTAPVLDDLINEAVQAISLEDDWPWQDASAILTTVIGQQNYVPTVTAGHVWLRTRAITQADADSLSWRSLIEVRENGTTKGDPAIYTVSEERIILAPIPTRVIAFTHDYVRQEPILVFNTDSPLMPVPFRFSVLHLAAALGHYRQNQSQRGDMEMQSYQGWLKRMQDNRRRVTVPARVRVRPGRMF